MATGCEGSLGQPGPGAGAGAGAGQGGSGATLPSPVPHGFLQGAGTSAVPIRRLTRAEYRNLVRELLGVEPPAAQALPDDSLSSGFTSTAGQLVTIAAVNRYLDAAADVADRLEPTIAQLVPCSGSDAAAEQQCVDAALTTLGSRLFRRPIAADEKARYVGVFQRSRASQTYEQSASLVIEALLVAPELLFIELPSGGAAGTAHPLDSWQVAARLSLLLWDSLPDAPLLAAAEQGALGSRAAVAEQVERMLLDPRTRPALASFFDDWLGLTKIESVVRDPALYPSVTPARLSELAAESRAFVDDVFWQANDFRRLFISSGEVSERSFGLLSQAGFLMTLAAAEKTAAIHRGVFLRRKLLCGVLPPPPPGLATPLPELTPGVSSRQRITEHTSGAGCVGCHQTFNPLGFTLEHFDVAGQWRDQDQGQPVDAKVAFTEPGLPAEVDGARAFSEALAQSPHARACAIQQLFTFALERSPTTVDQVLFDDLGRKFEAAGFSLKAVLTELALSDDFRSRIEPGGLP